MSRATASLQNPPSLIEYGKLRFLIMDSPTGARPASWLGRCALAPILAAADRHVPLPTLS